MRSARSLFIERVGRLNALQESAFPVISSAQNCLIMAPTGSGKTEAAILPILEAINSIEGEGVLALYVTPLRALNRDLMKRLEELCTSLGITIGVRHGDTSQKERREQVLHPPKLLITTPESIQNMLLSPRLRLAFARLKFVVVDELHELYQNKRGAQLSIGLERLEERAPGFTRIGISATIGDADEAAAFLFGKRPHREINSEVEKRLDVHVVMPTLPQRRHPEFEASFDLDDAALGRIEYLEDMIKSSKATLVFANTRQVVESLGSKIIYLSRLEGFDYVGIHHSSLDREERIQIEDSFKNGKINCIIATSSLELGIDIGRIDMVVQYGSPRQANRLLQRIGRGGHREGAVSKGVIIASSAIEALEAAATIKAASKKRLESHRMERMALDVLANQISGMVLEYRELPIQKAYVIVKRAAPYAELKESEFMRMAEFCASLGLIKINKEMLSLGRRSRTYFIENVSVIPDSRRFFVKRASTNKIISTLDERFVFANIDENASFITKGVPWKVVSIEGDTIFVEQGTEVEASIPDWEGEDIPVSFLIAESAVSYLAHPESAKEMIEPASYDAIHLFTEKQKRFFIPAGNRLLIEELDDYTILHLPLGKLANEFISRALAYTVRKAGGEISVRPTPYAIILDLKLTRKRPDPEKTFRALSQSDALASSGEIMAGSELFRYKFAQVAKLFGIAEKKAVLTKSALNRLIEFYRGTPVYDETVRDLKKNYIDYETVSSFLSGLSAGKIEISRVPSGSPLSRELLHSALGYRELMSGSDIADTDIEELKRKLSGKSVQLLCTYCSFTFSRTITPNKKDQDKILCMRCSSPMVSTYKQEYYDVLSKKKEGKRFTNSERETYTNVIKEASLVDAYGDRALMAFLTYGIGLSTAGKLLKIIRKNEKMFFEDLLRAQRLFIRNSRFWKRN